MVTFFLAIKKKIKKKLATKESTHMTYQSKECKHPSVQRTLISGATRKITPIKQYLRHDEILACKKCN